MKKMVLYVAFSAIVLSVAAAPDSKLIERFNQTFPHSENVKWRDDKDGYIVSFTRNESFNKAFYNRQGDFVYSLKYSNGLDLPANIMMELNRKYGESRVRGVTEVTTQTNTMYDIKLTKGAKLLCVQLSPDGSITNEEQFDYGGN